MFLGKSSPSVADRSRVAPVLSVSASVFPPVVIGLSLILSQGPDQTCTWQVAIQIPHNDRCKSSVRKYGRMGTCISSTAFGMNTYAKKRGGEGHIVTLHFLEAANATPSEHPII
jgi:hypothetical protein